MFLDDVFHVSFHSFISHSLVKSIISIYSFTCLFLQWWDQNQGLMHTRETLRHWTIPRAPSTFILSYAVFKVLVYDQGKTVTFVTEEKFQRLQYLLLLIMEQFTGIGMAKWKKTEQKQSWTGSCLALFVYLVLTSS